MDQSPATADQRLAYKEIIFLAAKLGVTESVVELLDVGVPIHTKDDEGMYLLHWAALGGHVTTMKLLIKRGCDVDLFDVEGCTPLHAAAKEGWTKAVRKLIKKGASKSVVAGNCGTPLHQAALSGHVETTVAMLEEGCSRHVVSSTGATVLHFAASGGNVDLVRELVVRGCDKNAEKADGCTPLHVAASCGRTEAVCELIKLGAAKSVVSRMHGTPLHQAVGSGCVETVEALLKDAHEPDSTGAEAIPSQPQLLERSSIDPCDSVGQTPVMWAVQYGLVEVFKLLISKGRVISDRDTHSLSVFEHCFVGGHASNLDQFCEASGISSSGEGLKCALKRLINRNLVDAQKVICLCAFSGDSVFLDDQFIELVAIDACAMPAAVKYTKFYFGQGEDDSFLNHLGILDENTLNPLHISLLSLNFFEMGFAISSVQDGTKDHTSFITNLLSHPVLKDTVHENLPNGLSPLDLAQQFELRRIAELIKRAGGRPGLWASVPQEIELRHPLALLQLQKAFPSMTTIAKDGKHGLEFMKGILSTVVEPSLWQMQAATVGANVGAETDTRKFQSLPPMASVDEVCDLIVKCNKDINAMLNHSEGGRIHFGIGSNGSVEVGLHLEQNEAITKLRDKVGKILRSFWPSVVSSIVQVEPVDLQNDKQELTGWWRFDIVVKPHPTVVQLAPKDTGYYRNGATSVRMTYGEFVRRIRAEPRPQGSPRAEPRPQGSPMKATVSSWDADKAATVGANVGAESAYHEYKTLVEEPDKMKPVEKKPDKMKSVERRLGHEDKRVAINAMLNHPTGGCIHFGINDDGIVEEGRVLEQNQDIDKLRKKVGDVLRNFWPPVEPVDDYVQVVPVNLQNVKDRWRYDIVVKPHPTVVQLSRDQPAYCRSGPQCHKMEYDELARKVRCEPAGQLPHGY